MLNKSLSKDHQVMSVADNTNERDVKERNVEEVHQNSNISENQSFMVFCKDNSTKKFQHLNCGNLQG